MFIDLKESFSETETIFFTGRVPELTHPTPGSEAARHFVQVLRDASTNPFKTPQQRRLFAVAFTGLLDRFQLRIDAGVSDRVYTLHGHVKHDQGGRPVDVDVLLKSHRGSLMNSIFGGSKRLGLFDVSARMQEGQYVHSDSPLIPLTADSPSIIRGHVPELTR